MPACATLGWWWQLFLAVFCSPIGLHLDFAPPDGQAACHLMQGI